MCKHWYVLASLSSSSPPTSPQYVNVSALKWEIYQTIFNISLLTSILKVLKEIIQLHEACIRKKSAPRVAWKCNLHAFTDLKQTS